MTCKVTYRYYLGMLSFLNEDFTKVRAHLEAARQSNRANLPIVRRGTNTGFLPLLYPST